MRTETSARLSRQLVVDAKPTEDDKTELALHLAGGTVRDRQALMRHFGEGAHWRLESPDAWRQAGLSAGLTHRLVEQVSLEKAELEW
ncbi:MAG: hypothetical protein ACI9EF_003669, partial [Pseudohongiellaceae bacterium]